MVGLPIHGRGAAENPAGRYERLDYEPDPDYEDPDDPEPRPATQFYRDTTRKIITSNDSPDVGFSFSVNPYRGCEHGCAYCLSGDTAVLLADGSSRPIRDLRVGEEIIGTAREGWYRRYVRTTVVAHWETSKLAYRVTLEDGTTIVASGDHRFLTDSGWKYVSDSLPGRRARPHLTTNNTLMGTGKFARESNPDRECELGYLTGMIRGDGLLASYHSDREGRANGDQHPFRLALVDREGLNRTEAFLLRNGIEVRTAPFAKPGAIHRPMCLIEGQALKSNASLRIVSVDPLGIELPMYDITTGTGDFIANGVVSHNCYARPTHEWLGLSAGLDFETKIFVKEDAPDLLRRELLSPKWEPATIAMSGVTDAYQPAERRFELTRRCLEVLAEFRNPVGIITKNHLVTRDVDILGEMAGYGAAMVNISITSLDPALQRVLEPRAATPERRLDALAKLSAAGVPVGVMVAPVIPGLTDHELPAILKAAAEAGARSAGFVPLRLPHGLGTLFSDWLERHVPDRREKVLNRVREMRGGKLNDPNFVSRMRGSGEYIDQLRALFHVTCAKVGLNRERSALSTASFRRPSPPPSPASAARRGVPGQIELF